MIGQTFNARIVSVSDESAQVMLPNGTSAVLPVAELVGKTRAVRHDMLSSLHSQVGSELACEVIDVREVDGQTVTTVSNYAVVRKQRLAEIAAIKTLSEKLAVSPAPFQATVLRVDNERGFAIIDLGNNLTGMLHVSGMIGDADTRNAALAATAPGDIKTVIFAQVSERRGRIRLDLNECAAA